MTETILRWQQIEHPAEGKAITFSFTQQFPPGSQIPAHDYEGFAVYFKGNVKAYRNSCPHMARHWTGCPISSFPKMEANWYAIPMMHVLTPLQATVFQAHAHMDWKYSPHATFSRLPLKFLPR